MFIAGSTLRWLLFMIIPYLIVLGIQFMVPMQFMLFSFPKSENIYNGYKLELEQNSVRAQAQLKKRIVERRLALWYRSTNLFIKFFKDPSPYMTITNSSLVYAGDVPSSNNNIRRSLWFAPNKTDPSQLDSLQQ